MKALDGMPMPVVLPLHPRTRAALKQTNFEASSRLHLVEPAGYLDFMALINGCAHVLTDSGGVQKEALFAGRPCTTLREETEWVETLEGGWNVLVGSDVDALTQAVNRARPSTPAPTHAFGDGRDGVAVVEAIAQFL